MRGTLQAVSVRDALEHTDAVPPPRPRWEPEEIIEATARLFGIAADVLPGPSRSPLHTDARTVAMLLLRAHAYLSWLEIGDLFDRAPGTCSGAVTNALGQPHRLAWAKAVQQELERTHEV